MTDVSSATLRDTIARLAPGTALRDGLERILRGRTGGLIVLGFDERVAALCDGGFELDVEFAPTRLRELSKMDGAVVVSTDGSRIVRANVQLVPDHRIPTVESGTRHRAAERTAIETGYPVVSVSQSMSTSSARSLKMLRWASSSRRSRSARVVMRMGSTLLMRNGSMRVLGMVCRSLLLVPFCKGRSSTASRGGCWP